MPIDVGSDGFVFIPTGTKDKPAGITNTECHFILFTRPEGFAAYSKEEVLGFLRKNWANEDVITKTLDEEYKVYGAKFNVFKLEE